MTPGPGRTAASSGTLAAHRYQDFLEAVSRRQLTDWLSGLTRGSIVVDLTPGFPTAGLGFNSVGLTNRPLPPVADVPVLPQVFSDPEALSCLRSESVHALVAESGAWPYCVGIEDTLASARRVLRPGGRLFLCVDSLAHGLGQLAAMGRWAELADAPNADVVLVTGEDGGITRVYTLDDLTATLSGAGFDVEWVRPRTVLSVEAVTRALQQDPGSLNRLVNVELEVSLTRSADGPAAALIASAVRR